MNIYLRKVTKDDSRYIVQWRNNTETAKHFMDNKEVSEESNIDFYNSYIATGKYIQYIVEKVDDEFNIFSYPIGTVYLKNFKEDISECELGFFPSDDSEWNDEAKRMAIKELLKIAVQDLGYHNIYSYAFKDCKDEIELLTTVGFKKENVFISKPIVKNGDVRQLVLLKINL